LQKVKNDFFVGSGLQSFRIRDDNFGSLTETHNTYLSILVDTGILGLILYLFFYFFILIRILKKKKYLKLMDYDLASIIYILSLLLAFNFINFEYTLSIWLLNGICLTRAFIK
jgi:O-antigen ligase